MYRREEAAGNTSGGASEPVFVVHHIGQVRAAARAGAEAGVAVTVLSAPGAASYMGAAVFAAMVDIARGEVPAARLTAVLDCGADAGRVLNALRHGLGAVVFTGPDPAARRLADIARQSNARLLHRRPAAIDLDDADDAEALCRESLNRA